MSEISREYVSEIWKSRQEREQELLARIADLEREVETLRRLAREDKEARLKALGEVSGH